MSTRRVPADRQLSWEPGRDVSAALLDEQSRGDSVPEGGTLRSLTMTVALSQAPPAPRVPGDSPHLGTVRSLLGNRTSWLIYSPQLSMLLLGHICL